MAVPRFRRIELTGERSPARVRAPLCGETLSGPSAGDFLLSASKMRRVETRARPLLRSGRTGRSGKVGGSSLLTKRQSLNHSLEMSQHSLSGPGSWLTPAIISAHKARWTLGVITLIFVIDNNTRVRYG